MRVTLFLISLLATLNRGYAFFYEAVDDVVNFVNTADTTWEATNEFVDEFPIENLRARLGLWNLSDFDRQKFDSPSFEGENQKLNKIPSSFDCRKKWPRCKTMWEIPDQGNCGSCWAVTATATFSDRLCIAKKQRESASLSAQQLTFCCKKCGSGCNGGYIEQAWSYFKTNGVVTGGSYKSNVGCQPYEIPPSNSAVSFKDIIMGLSAQYTCSTKCTNANYRKSYASDFHYTKSVIKLSSSVSAIQNEILRHGPVEAGFDVYKDFYYYKKGIYQHVKGSSYEGGHAAKIFGWGEEKGTKYWICTNSWGPKWGEGGTFRIVRGKNECLMEQRVVTGIPKV